MYAPIIHYLPDAQIERKRVVPGMAKILVRRGQAVSALDPVLERINSNKHLLLDITSGLRLSPEKAETLISCKPGATVNKGDLLAGPSGLSRRVIRAPESGRIVDIWKGNVLLELADRPGHYLAGLTGMVNELIPERGVIIKAHGALVQGGWGNGKIGEGILKVLIDEKNQELTPEILDSSFSDMILVINYCRDAKALEQAKNLSIRGIVLAGLHPALLKSAISLDIPIMVIEGFGVSEFNSKAREILFQNDGFTASLNAEGGQACSADHPELFISKESSANAKKPVTLDMFAPGKDVRSIGPTSLGQSGKLIDLLGEIILPSGIRSIVAKVQYFDGQQENVPLCNLEIIA